VTGLAIAVGVAILVALFIIILFKAFYRVPKSDQALVITGFGIKKESGYKVVTGSGTLVWPVFQRVGILKLSANQSLIQVEAVDSQKIPIGVRGSVVFKVGDDDASIANAARRFLGEQDDMRGVVSQMEDLVTNVLHGHLRSILGGITVEDLIANRNALAQEARDAVKDEMDRLGLVIDSLQIQDIVDPSGYIKSLGAPRAAEVAMAARIAAAQRDQEATQAEQQSEVIKQSALRDTAVKAAEYQATRDKAASIAAQAGPLADAESRQAVVEKETMIAGLEAEREQARLVAQVQRPAEAQAAALRTGAEAARDARIAAAQAEAKERELSLAAQADAVIAQQVAEKVAEQLPAIVQAAASAFSNIDNFTVLNGAEGVTDTIAKIVGSAGPLLDIARNAVNRPTNGAGNGATEASDDWHIPAKQ
jgi:flotillin